MGIALPVDRCKTQCRARLDGIVDRGSEVRHGILEVVVADLRGTPQPWQLRPMLSKGCMLAWVALLWSLALKDGSPWTCDRNMITWGTCHAHALNVIGRYLYHI